MSESIANVEQAEAWNEGEGLHWAAHQDRYDSLMVAFTERLLDAAEIAETDRVLDIGCGNGQTTRLAAERARRGQVTGIDLSEPMLARAAATADDQSIGNITFVQGDAQMHPFEHDVFDVAISRYGVMFFAHPVAAFVNIGAALRPGGRLAFVCWQDLAANEWLTTTAGAALQHVPLPDLGEPDAPGVFAFADPERVRTILHDSGFEAIGVEPVEAPMRFGDDAEDAVRFLRGTGMGRALLDPVDDDTREHALDAVAEALRPHERDGGVHLNGAAWLVTGSIRSS